MILLSVGVGCGRVAQFSEPGGIPGSDVVTIEARVVDRTIEVSVGALSDRQVVLPRSRAIYRVEYLDANGDVVLEVPVIALSVAKQVSIGPTTRIQDSADLVDLPESAVSVRVTVHLQLESGTVLNWVDVVALPV